MILKNVSGQGVYLYAVDTTSSPYLGKTGDASNITGFWSLDGGAETSGFGTAHPTEIGGGAYWQPLAQAETNCNRGSARWVSSTTGIVITPLFFETNGGLLPGVRKNVALPNFHFPMVSSTDHVSPVSVATVTVTLAKDAAGFAASTNSASEIGTSGVYTIDLAA